MAAPRIAFRVPARPELLLRPRTACRFSRSATTRPTRVKNLQNAKGDRPAFWPLEFVTKTARYTLYTLPLALTLLPWLPYTTVAVNGQSMTPVLSPAAHAQGSIGQDVLLVKQASHLHLFASPREEGGSGRGVEGVNRNTGVKGLRGAIVVFRTPHDPERAGVKRAVAIEGDTVVVRRDFRHRWRTAVETGQVLGEVVLVKSADTSSDCPRSRPSDGQDFDVKIKVPYGRIWVEGENAAHSRDSNDYGPISKTLIEGLAVGIISPSERTNLGVEWEDDGWRERWRKRGFQWRDEARGTPSALNEDLEVPEEWRMHPVI